MRKFLIMQDDNGFSQSSSKAGIKRRIPLPVLVTKPHYHHVGMFNQGTGSNRIDLRTFVVMLEIILFRPEDSHTAIITPGMIRHRRYKLDF